MVQEDYVSYKTAKLLKEKGFDEPCHTAYSLAGKTHKVEQRSISDWGKINQVKRPTLQMAMKWLRELKRCVIVIIPKWFTPYGCAKYAYSIWADDNLEIDGETVKDTEYDTYEKTCEEAIRYCLEKLI